MKLIKAFVNPIKIQSIQVHPNCIKGSQVKKGLRTRRLQTDLLNYAAEGCLFSSHRFRSIAAILLLISNVIHRVHNGSLKNFKNVFSVTKI